MYCCRYLLWHCLPLPLPKRYYYCFSTNSLSVAALVAHYLLSLPWKRWKPCYSNCCGLLFYFSPPPSPQGFFTLTTFLPSMWHTKLFSPSPLGHYWQIGRASCRERAYSC